MKTFQIKKLALENDNYRKIIHTSQHIQIVLMSLLPHEDITLETHDGHDQFFYVVQGNCLIKANNKEHILDTDMITVVKAGTSHYVKNISNTNKLKLFTIYSPPEHPNGIIQQFKSSPYIAKTQQGGSNKYKIEYETHKTLMIGGSNMWKVHVSLPWYNLIKDGKKSVEGRPNRKDFAQMKIGDKIEFFNKELNENFMTEITNVSHHKTFEEMIRTNGIDNVLPGIRTIDEGVQVYMQYYTKDIEAEFGVVGIHVKLI